MRKSLVLSVLLFIVSFGYAQEDSAQVHQVIISLFDGMRESDSAKVHASFRDDVKMYSSFKGKDGSQKLHAGSLVEFLTAIGTPHDKVWNEGLSNTIIQIDGGIAQVWTDYTFHIGDELSHCGVDAFQLVKLDGAWKIIHLLDTRRRTGCE